VKPGLTDVLTGSAAVEKSVQKGGVEEFSVVRSGERSANPVRLLAADRIKGVFQKLAEQHDIVIIDGPPVMGLADAVLLARSVDAVLVVAEANRTLLTQLNVALSRLPGSNIIGGIITKFDAKAAGVHYGDYNYYTYEDNSSRVDEPVA
jgi:Mrp family chromosome partitioning ATPase